MMQSTTGLQNQIPPPRFPGTTGLVDNPLAFHAPNRRFNPNAHAGNATILGFFFWGQLLPPRFLFGLPNSHPFQRNALTSGSPISRTPLWHRVRFVIRDPLVMFFPFAGPGEKPDVTAPLNEAVVVHRRPLLFHDKMVVALRHLSAGEGGVRGHHATTPSGRGHPSTGQPHVPEVRPRPPLPDSNMDVTDESKSWRRAGASPTDSPASLGLAVG